MSDQIARSSTESYQPDSLIIGGLADFGRGTLASGQDLTRGAILGRVTASGELTLSVETATDGSEEPVGALCHDTDASGGAEGCQFARGGWLNEHVVNFDASWTVDTLNAAFDGTPLSIVKPY
ncbi:head decoration protein [Marinobacter sp. M1N3S26]|uniref:head decoration protein n=1 Tax=Marinobacter sp. M1N3S26 TaxID=3382299 RepID=UPI00387B46C1